MTQKQSKEADGGTYFNVKVPTYTYLSIIIIVFVLTVAASE